MTPTLAQSYPATADSVPRARHAVTEFARAAGVDDEQLDNICLAASEAITNAVRHAYRRGEAGSVHVAAALAGDELWVLVSDEGHGLEARTQSPGLGLGLSLIASVAEEFAVVNRAIRGIELRMRFAVKVRRDQRRGSVASATSAASSAFSTTR
jgi:anti-sigma regulatory factor (Ser/Thr protein kinase)